MAIVQLFCIDTSTPVEHEPATHTDDAIPAPIFETFCVAIPTAKCHHR